MLAAKAFFDTPAARLTPQVEEGLVISLMTGNKLATLLARRIILRTLVFAWFSTLDGPS